MENVSIDPLGGVYTRLGWQRWNGADIVPEGTAWDPRRAYLVQFSDGVDVVYVAANNKLYRALASSGAAFSEIVGIDAQAVPHMADFAAFGDTVYIAVGRGNPMVRAHRLDAVEEMVSAGSGNWNDDYLTPGVVIVAPQAELVEAHAGYLFAANLVSDDVTYPNRIRWSHPTSQTDWASADFIDIDTGGNRICGLMSYEDHLLIFKPDSIWALYGYDAESWQLVQKSSTIGAVSPQAISRNEQVVFFYSGSDRGGIYAYNGERPAEVSEALRYVFENISASDLVWVGWVARKLWVALPWTYDGPTNDNAAAFVFDPSVGERGAWMYFTSTEGSLGPIVAGSNVDTMLRPLGVLRATETPCVVRLEAIADRAADQIWQFTVWGWSDSAALAPDDAGVLTTGADEEIKLTGQGSEGDNPFTTLYRTPWIDAGWPTRKKSFRRPDVICRYTGIAHDLKVRSYRDYEELHTRRQHILNVPSGGVGDQAGPPGQVAAYWNTFAWNDGTVWNQSGSTPDFSLGPKAGASIRRGSSFGLCRALQLRIEGNTVGAKWGIDAIVMKIVLRRFR